MGKTPILSALALAIATSAIVGSMAYAEENLSAAVKSSAETTTSSVTVDASASNIKSLQEKVSQASENTKDNQTYPGLSKYLSELASFNATDGNQEYANALNDAILAANLLSGRDVTVASTSNENTKNARSVDVNNDVAVQTSDNVVANMRTVAEPALVVETKTTQVAAQNNNIQTAVAQVAEAQPTATLATAIKITVASPEQVVAQSNDVAVKNFDDQGTTVDDELTNKDESNAAPEVTPELPKTGEIESNLGILIAAGAAVALIVLGSTAAILKGKNKRLEK